MEVNYSDLPSFSSPLFWVIVVACLTLPYVFTLIIYAYHFRARQQRASIRGPEDQPTKEHQFDWKTSIIRPEGVSAVTGYMAVCMFTTFVADIDVIPAAMKDLSLAPRPLVVLGHFLVFDALMILIHYAQHNWRWLYRVTHAVHHGIRSPTILVALTGHLPDTMLLILLPLHLTLYLVPYGNFSSVFLFSGLALAHLHVLHAEFTSIWDPYMRKLGLVTTLDHHVHHLKPHRNLAHFFTFLDRFLGTYTCPSQLPELANAYQSMIA
jgi:sterol desaturase/sphingolipid hydroxylase (fatty acid hydroxylase superfamily)